ENPTRWPMGATIKPQKITPEDATAIFEANSPVRFDGTARATLSLSGWVKDSLSAPENSENSHNKPQPIKSS
ncbi:MAG: hypothetical protein AAFU56_07215, partial [Pseudomonadota bacterium]